MDTTAVTTVASVAESSGWNWPMLVICSVLLVGLIGYMIFDISRKKKKGTEAEVEEKK